MEVGSAIVSIELKRRKGLPIWRRVEAGTTRNVFHDSAQSAMPHFEKEQPTDLLFCIDEHHDLVSIQDHCPLAEKQYDHRRSPT